jgi:polysaccharide chain length determinant protein (PEP-CTERM system associated)
MNQGLRSLEAHARHALQSLWKRRWLAVSTAWVAALIAAPVVMLIPNRYEASAQVYVDTQTVLKPLMQDLAYTPDIDQQVKMLARTLISRPNVERLIDRPELGLRTADPMERQRTIAGLMDRIKVSLAGPVGLYSITFRDGDPLRAKRTVEGTLELFVDAGAHGKKRDSEEASQFIDEQIKSYEGKLIEAENRLKEFKLRNFGVSGVASQDFFARMSVLAEEVSRLRVDLAAAEHSRDAYRRELSAEAPQLPLEMNATGAPLILSEVDTRLEAQRKLLDEMLRRYTDEHPDVISARRIIAQLEGQKRQEAEKRAAAVASGNVKAIAATSPVYQKIRVALAETEAQVASLRSQLGLKEARLEQIRATAGKVPQVEAELAQLNRDYDTINKKYQTLVSRRESASLGVKLDESSRLAEFRVVEPPRVSPTPVFPARLHLAALAALVAIALGIAAPLLLDQIFPTFRDVDALQKATGRKVLGSISLAVSDERRRGLRTQGIGVAVAGGALLMVQAGWMVWLLTRTTT